LRPNRITHSTVMSACEKSQQWAAALSLFQRVRQDGDMDVIVFNAGISACTRGGLWSLVLDLVREMKQRKLPPDMVTYSVASTGRRR